MKGLLITLSALGVMGLAFWAYQENYRTQSAQKDTAVLKHEIGALRHKLAMLNAEWAYLNRPERLRGLAELNFETLGLMPFQPNQFGNVKRVAMPPIATMLGMAPVDVNAEGEAGEQLP